MKIINTDQNSDDWFNRREGRITGSRSGKVLISKIAGKTEMINAIIRESGIEDKKEIKEFKDVVKEYSLEKLESMLSEEQWLEFFYRAQKKEYWKIMAEQLGYHDEDENGLYEDPRDRGHRLEDTAAEFLERTFNLQTVKVGICVRDDYENIGISPDRLIVDKHDNLKIDDNGFITNTDEVVFVAGVEIKNPGVANHLQIIHTNMIPEEYWWQAIQYFVVCDIQKLYFVSHCPNAKDRPLHVIIVERKDIEKDIKSSFDRQVKTLEQMNKDVFNLTF